MDRLEDRESFISIRVQSLAVILGKKLPEELIAVFQKCLSVFPIHVLSSTFSKAEKSLEKFPTPRRMAELCREEMPSEDWRYQFKPGVDPHGVACMIDPDPKCPEEKYLYKWHDCEEGRIFMKLLREVARQKAL